MRRIVAYGILCPEAVAVVTELDQGFELCILVLESMWYTYKVGRVDRV